MSFGHTGNWLLVPQTKVYVLICCLPFVFIWAIYTLEAADAVTLHPQLSHTVPQTKLSERCVTLPKAFKLLCGPALGIYTDQQVPKESMALAETNGAKGSRHFPATGSCQPQTRGHQQLTEICVAFPLLTF